MFDRLRTLTGTFTLPLTLLVAGCGSTATVDATPDMSTSADLAAAPDLAKQDNLRGQRYCEVLLATLNAPNVHIEVYNTIGLNDCPDAMWKALDAKQVAAASGVAFAVLNGPRYWMIDGFVMGQLVDPTVKSFGGIDMRQAGAIDLPLAQAMGMQTPYVQHMIQRTTVVRFDAGKPVYELVDADGKVYEMQSYSTQYTMQTEADLPNLGAKLKLPTGWTFRTRTLAADLQVTAVNNIGIVVQDDFQDSYQQSQQ